MQKQQETITIQAIVSAPIEKVWQYWNQPEHIQNWGFASSDWEVPSAENDLREGGTFKTRMQSKDGKHGFDFGGTYDLVEEHKHIAYTLGDGREVSIVFEELPDGVHITQTFDPEKENSLEMQRDGWQAILNNFKKYAESQP